MLKSFQVGTGQKFLDHDWDSGTGDGQISSGDSKLIGSRITPYAYQKLQILPQTLKYLLLVTSQQFCHTPMFLFNSTNFSLELLKDKAKRRKYETHFQFIKKHVTIIDRIRQKQASGELPPENPLLANLCFLFQKIDEQKSQGYYTYYKYEDADELGTECVVLYYHKTLKKCVIVIAQPKVYSIWQVVINHIILTSTVLPFHKDCSFCGRCAEDLIICNGCKVERYCNKTCQTSHWKDHQCVCQKRKMKLSQQEIVKSKLLTTNPFLLWKQLVGSSRRLQEMESGQIADADEEMPMAALCLSARARVSECEDAPVDVEEDVS